MGGGWWSRVWAWASADRRTSGRIGRKGSKGATAGAGESDRQVVALRWEQETPERARGRRPGAGGWCVPVTDPHGGYGEATRGRTSRATVLLGPRREAVDPRDVRAHGGAADPGWAGVWGQVAGSGPGPAERSAAGVGISSRVGAVSADAAGCIGSGTGAAPVGGAPTGSGGRIGSRQGSEA